VVCGARTRCSLQRRVSRDQPHRLTARDPHCLGRTRLGELQPMLGDLILFSPCQSLHRWTRSCALGNYKSRSGKIPGSSKPTLPPLVRWCRLTSRIAGPLSFLVHKTISHRNALHSPHSAASVSTTASTGCRTSVKAYSTTYLNRPPPAA